MESWRWLETERTMVDSGDDSNSARTLIALAALGWLSMLAVDFFLHAGLLAELYTRASPFLLPPEDAFRRIPLGYLSFLILDVLLLWLMLKLDIRTWRGGFAFGMILGAMIWGSLTLGLYSISRASPMLLLGWFAGQSVELGVAGAVIGSGLAGTSLRRLFLYVLSLLVTLVILTIVLQNIGWAPATAPTELRAEFGHRP